MIVELEIILIIIVIALLGLTSLLAIMSRPYDISPLIVLCSIFFILFPGVLIYFDSELVQFIIFPIAPAKDEIFYALEKLTMYSLFLMIGSMMAAPIVQNAFSRNKAFNTNLAICKDSRIKITTRDCLLILFTLIVTFAFFTLIYSSQDISLFKFFLPARYEMKGSYYFEVWYRVLPLAVAVVFTLKNRKFTLVANSFYLIALIAAISLAQRRDILSVFLTVLALKLLLNNSGFKKNRSLFSLSLSQLRIFKKLFIYSLLFLMLIPALWWFRSLATSIVRDKAISVAPWHHRGFFELLARSPGTGFETFMAVHRMVETDGIKPFYSFFYPLYVWVPRSLWPAKPLNIENFMVEYYGLTGHPSIFLPGDLYLNFGPYYWLFASALIGFALTFISVKALHNKNTIIKLLWIATFANVAALFKNGVCGFIGLFGFMAVLLLVIWIVMRIHNCEEN